MRREVAYSVLLALAVAIIAFGGWLVIFGPPPSYDVSPTPRTTLIPPYEASPRRTP